MRALSASAAPTQTILTGNTGGPWGLAYAAFLGLCGDYLADDSGRQSGYQTGSRSTLAPAEALVPEGWNVLSTWEFGHESVRVIESPEKDVAFCSTSGYGEARVELFSPSGPERATTLVAQILDPLPEIEPPDKGLSVQYWFMTGMGPRSVRREIDAPDWADVAGNYPAQLRSTVENLTSWRSAPSSGGGRLLLAHGPPGTGKTFVLRTLAREWRDWADVHVITDPDEFFGQSAYMLSVLLDDDDHLVGGSPGKWRLVVVEDCDEILSANARERSGHAVSRLLNLADGMVGQGLRVLLLLTTNETVDNFHEAIVRPGRCLANMYFGPFDADEADAWREAQGIPSSGEPATLAELYSQARAERLQRVARVADRLRGR